MIKIRHKSTGIPKGDLTVDDWKFRITQGRHEIRDRQIWVQAPGATEWDLVSIPAVAAMVRALYMNEDIIRGPERGMRGGEYLLEFLAAVCTATANGDLGPIQHACQQFKMPTPTITFEAEE